MTDLLLPVHKSSRNCSVPKKRKVKRKRLVFVRELAGSFSGSVVKNPPANARDSGDKGSIPVWGISPREGNGSPLQYSCLENSMDRGAWWAIVHGGCKESDTSECLSTAPQRLKL